LKEIGMAGCYDDRDDIIKRRWYGNGRFVEQVLK
jgi:hypothetical protein